MLCTSMFVHGASVQHTHLQPFLFTTPNVSGNRARTLALAEKRAGWDYGPSIAGNTAFYPTGSIGGPAAKQVADGFSAFLSTINAKVVNDSRISAAWIVEVCKPCAPRFWSPQLTYSRQVD
jgi:arachidonate 15-lipoxygenase (second type)/8-lipoxygenase (S-type)